MIDRRQELLAMLHAFWARDWPVVARYIADDAVYEDPLLPEPVCGREAIVDVLRYYHEWGDLHPEIRNLFAGGDSDVTIRATTRALPHCG